MTSRVQHLPCTSCVYAGNRNAMTKGTGGMDVMMGDLVLLQDEVNPVMSGDTRPTIYFLHYWGTGAAEKLAPAFKAVLAETGTPTPASAAVKQQREGRRRGTTRETISRSTGSPVHG
jgi:hypothetical protein